MEMEDCKEMIELRPVHGNSGGAAASPASPAPSSLSPSYHHSQQAQPQQTHHQNTHSHTPPLHPHQLPHAHQHFNYPLMHTHGPDADDVSMACAGKEHCTYDDDILMRSASKEHNTCANNASTRSTNTAHLHQTNNVDAGLMKPFPTYSYSSMHISEATRPNTESTLGMSASGMGVAMHHQEAHGIIANPSISDASTTTPPQPSGTPQMSYAMTIPLPDSFKKKRGKARKCSVDGDFSSGPSSVALSTTTKTGHHYRARAQMSALDQGLRPHIIAIARGEDVSARITSFQQEGNWGICVLSALGSISNVTLRHSETSGGTITYEGCYDILSLSGSLSPIGNEGSQNRGGLIVSLAGLDGRVIGGEVTGIFVAASPIKVVIGTFSSEAHLSQMERQNISQVETAAGSPSCASIPLQQTSTLDRRLGSAVGDSQLYQCPSHMVTSHFVDREGTGNVVDA